MSDAKLPRLPFLARVAAGVAASVFDEALKVPSRLAEDLRTLPTDAAQLPMTLVSDVLTASMRLQQQATALAIKGDEALASLSELVGMDTGSGANATFDEDLDDDDVTEATASTAVKKPAPKRAPANKAPAKKSASKQSATKQSATKQTAAKQAPAKKAPAKRPAAKKAPNKRAAGKPADGVVERIGYPELTLAELRTGLGALSIDELETLLAYEDAHAARGPFRTVLGNRITTLRAQ